MTCNGPEEGTVPITGQVDFPRGQGMQGTLGTYSRNGLVDRVLQQLSIPGMDEQIRDGVYVHFKKIRFEDIVQSKWGICHCHV